MAIHSSSEDNAYHYTKLFKGIKAYNNYLYVHNAIKALYSY